MAVDINDVRLSLIWAELNPALLNEPAPADAPMAALGRRHTYKSLFEQILASQSSIDWVKNLPLHLLMGAANPVPMLGPPWPKPTGQRFWQRYLEAGSLDSVGGIQAWRSLVPLRVRFPYQVESPSWLTDSPKPLSLSVLFEAFFYPHGTALVANIVCRGAQDAGSSSQAKPFTLEDAVGFAFKVRQEKFNVQWKGDAGLFSAFQWNSTDAQELTLDELGRKGLSALRVAALGPSSASSSAAILDPFTIFTVVKGIGADPTAQIDSTLQRALEGVTKWSDTWPYDSLPELDKTRIEIKTSPPSHLLYGRKRGRAGWFPAKFINKKYSLACYHRNLVFASLQVESLYGLTAIAAQMIRNNQTMSVPLNDCARQAAGSLGRLYGGTIKTYRSMSPRIQIEQNEYVDDINDVRKFFFGKDETLK